MGNLFIADLSNHSIRKVDLAGVMTTVAGTGVRQDRALDVDLGVEQGLERPLDVATDSEGNVYIADTNNHKVRKLSPSGQIEVVAGNGRRSSAGDGGPATEAELDRPTAVAVDSQGRMYIVTQLDFKVRVVDPDGIIRTLAGTGQRGSSGDGGPATEAELDFPRGVEVDEEGNVYIADSNRIRIVSPDGIINELFQLQNEPFQRQQTVVGVARDSSGALYVTTGFGNTVLRWTPETGLVTVAGNGERGFRGDGGPATDASLFNPRDVALDASGRIFVADTNNHRIRLLTPAAGPSVSAAGFVHAASFVAPPFAPASIVSLFGLNLAGVTEVATSTPLPTSLAGTTVTVTDSEGVARLAALFFVSSGQINFLIPEETAEGLATITVTDSEGRQSSATINIVSVAPGLFSANSNGEGVAAASWARAHADGTHTFGLIFEFDSGSGVFVARPVDLGAEDDEVFLVLFGTGIRNRSDLSAVTATVGGEPVDVTFAGEQGEFVGLDQINAGPLPRSLIGRGEVRIVLTVDGLVVNVVTVTFL